MKRMDQQGNRDIREKGLEAIVEVPGRDDVGVVRVGGGEGASQSVVWKQDGCGVELRVPEESAHYWVGGYYNRDT